MPGTWPIRKSGCTSQNATMFAIANSVARVISTPRGQRSTSRPYQVAAPASSSACAKLV